MVALIFRSAHRCDHHQVQRGGGAQYSRTDARLPAPSDPVQLAGGRDHNGVQLALVALRLSLANSLRVHRPLEIAEVASPQFR